MYIISIYTYDHPLIITSYSQFTNPATSLMILNAEPRSEPKKFDSNTHHSSIVPLSR